MYFYHKMRHLLNSHLIGCNFQVNIIRKREKNLMELGYNYKKKEEYRNKNFLNMLQVIYCIQYRLHILYIYILCDTYYL